jgi:hypothetical protein
LTAIKLLTIRIFILKSKKEVSLTLLLSVLSLPPESREDKKETRARGGARSTPPGSQISAHSSYYIRQELAQLYFVGVVCD